jgi:CBS domain-containing protein
MPARKAPAPKPSKAKFGIRIREIMTRDIVTIHPKASLQEAAVAMGEHCVGMLPVCEGERICGLLTDRDITVRATAAGLNPARARVRDVMTPQVYFCYDFEDLQEAVDSFAKKQIRRLLVLDRAKKLVGVLSIGDLAVDTGNQLLAGEVLKRISEPERLVS